jgi:hypothetical protein
VIEAKALAERDVPDYIEVDPLPVEYVPPQARWERFVCRTLFYLSSIQVEFGSRSTIYQTMDQPSS